MNDSIHAHDAYESIFDAYDADYGRNVTGLSIGMNTNIRIGSSKPEPVRVCKQEISRFST